MKISYFSKIHYVLLKNNVNQSNIQYIYLLIVRIRYIYSRTTVKRDAGSGFFSAAAFSAQCKHLYAREAVFAAGLYPSLLRRLQSAQSI